MTVTVSKRVADKGTITKSVTNVVTTHGPETVDKLTAILFPEGLPENLTFEMIFAAMERHLSTSFAELQAADHDLSQEMADDQAPRDLRDQGVFEVRQMLVRFSSTVDASYGPSALAEYGLSSDIPRSHELLLSTAQNTERLLRSNPFSGRRPLDGCPALNNLAMANALAGKIRLLNQGLVQVNLEQREYDLALIRRDEALDRWQRSYRGVAGSISSLFAFCGEDELARRVRPTVRRRAGRPEVEDIALELPPSSSGAGDDSIDDG